MPPVFNLRSNSAQKRPRIMSEGSMAWYDILLGGGYYFVGLVGGGNRQLRIPDDSKAMKDLDTFIFERVNKRWPRDTTEYPRVEALAVVNQSLQLGADARLQLMQLSSSMTAVDQSWTEYLDTSLRGTAREMNNLRRYQAVLRSDGATTIKLPGLKDAVMRLLLALKASLFAMEYVRVNYAMGFVEQPLASGLAKLGEAIDALLAALLKIVKALPKIAATVALVAAGGLAVLAAIAYSRRKPVSGNSRS
jgi:hypothetical protein